MRREERKGKKRERDKGRTNNFLIEFKLTFFNLHFFFSSIFFISLLFFHFFVLNMHFMPIQISLWNITFGIRIENKKEEF